MILEPSILKQTQDWITLSKPSGWLSVPPRIKSISKFQVLKNWLCERFGDHIRIVHRLDRETSGVMIVALNIETQRVLSRAFEKHEVKKEYDFVASAYLSQPALRVNLPIDGKNALTLIEQKEIFNNAFLGQARPLTGRTHQIRIHLAVQKTPIFGDVRYGGVKSYQGIDIERTLLHARLLEIKELGIHIEAPWPQDLKVWVDRLRKSVKS